jgi:FkbM family methyltransferase
MNLLINKPAQLLKNVREIRALGADRPSRRDLTRNMLLANLKRTHHGWWSFACRFLGGQQADSQLCFPPLVTFSHRSGTTDLLVLEQVFLDREYQVESVQPQSIEYIVDLGSNIGVTAMYWAQQYPNAKMVLVEPDPDNFRLLQKNTSAFRDRCLLLQAAVSNQRGQAGFFRSSREYGHSMIKMDDCVSQIEVRALTVSDVIDAAGFPRVDLLKMDIEGGEEVVMPTIRQWKHTPRYIIAELHPPYDTAAFARDCETAGLRVANGATTGFSSNLPFAFRADASQPTCAIGEA